MCLNTIKKINQKKDITCYKVLYTVHDGDYGGFSMLSIVRDYPYEMGVVHSTNTDSPQIKETDTKKPYITGNSFHSFKTLYGAKKMVKFLRKHNRALLTFPINSIAIIIVKCVIPSDSNFTYKGRYLETDFNLRSYASEKLKPIKIVAYYPLRENVLPFFMMAKRE